MAVGVVTVIAMATGVVVLILALAAPEHDGAVPDNEDVREALAKSENTKLGRNENGAPFRTIATHITPKGNRVERVLELATGRVYIYEYVYGDDGCVFVIMNTNHDDNHMKTWRGP